MLFSNQLIVGVMIMKREKYRSDAIWPMIMKGCSTGIPPIQVRIITSATRSQKRNCVRGRNVRLRCLDVCKIGTNISTRIEASKARTPPSLLGIERRIA